MVERATPALSQAPGVASPLLRISRLCSNSWTVPRVVLCEHSHLQHLIQLPDRPLVLNPGSVGCPSYDNPGADPHVSVAGSPHARYAILIIYEHDASAELVAISYGWRSASARAEANGRAEWAHSLRTGWFMANAPLQSSAKFAEV